MKEIKVLVVDDSALIRALLVHIIDAEPDMKVVGVAPHPLIARELIKAQNPDVLTLDIEMPKMDGLDFLERLMRLRPMPVVMLSTLTERGSQSTCRLARTSMERHGAAQGRDQPRTLVGQSARQHRETDRNRRVDRWHRGDPGSFDQFASRRPGGVGDATYAGGFYLKLRAALGQPVSYFGQASRTRRAHFAWTRLYRAGGQPPHVGAKWRRLHRGDVPG